MGEKFIFASQKEGKKNTALTFKYIHRPGIQNLRFSSHCLSNFGSTFLSSQGTMHTQN